MKILGIETSCDETAVCIVEAEGGLEKPSFKVLGDALFSQVKLHAEYGGVFPSLAKREHAKNLVPLFKKALQDAGLLNLESRILNNEEDVKIKKILEREYNLYEQTKELLSAIKKPDLDLISVTYGPGLEPALWVGINFAHALSVAWNIPLVGENHMEGHMVSPLLNKELGIKNKGIMFPALALLISGGHTELVHMKDWAEYEVIGRTRDDAVGEAFDKVARLMNLPYPGGPEISHLASQTRQAKPAHDSRMAHTTPQFKLPRPMIKTDDYDFSFSGIKTAVLYSLKKIPDVNGEVKKEMALEFENAVTEVLVAKTRKALEQYNVKTLILGGGVIANTYIRQEFQKLVEEFAEVKLLIPEIKLATDNAVMIAAAAYLNFTKGKKIQRELKAEGNLTFH
jgi:N6-L-threonylcarbamoyladenine synthase